MTIEDAQARLQTEMQAIYQNVEHVLHTEYAGFDSAAGPERGGAWRAGRLPCHSIWVV